MTPSPPKPEPLTVHLILHIGKLRSRGKGGKCAMPILLGQICQKFTTVDYLGKFAISFSKIIKEMANLFWFW